MLGLVGFWWNEYLNYRIFWLINVWISGFLVEWIFKLLGFWMIGLLDYLIVIRFMDIWNDVLNNIMDMMMFKIYENVFIIGNFRLYEEKFIMLFKYEIFYFLRIIWYF